MDDSFDEVELEAAQYLRDLAADMARDDSCCCSVCEREKEKVGTAERPEEKAAVGEKKNEKPDDDASNAGDEICQARKEAAFLAISKMDKVLRKRPNLHDQDPEASPDLRKHLLRMAFEDKVRLLWQFNAADVERAEMVAEDGDWRVEAHPILRTANSHTVVLVT